MSEENRDSLPEEFTNALDTIQKAKTADDVLEGKAVVHVPATLSAYICNIKGDDVHPTVKAYAGVISGFSADEYNNPTAYTKSLVYSFLALHPPAKKPKTPNPFGENKL